MKKIDFELYVVFNNKEAAIHFKERLEGLNITDDITEYLEERTDKELFYELSSTGSVEDISLLDSIELLLEEATAHIEEVGLIRYNLEERYYKAKTLKGGEKLKESRNLKRFPSKDIDEVHIDIWIEYNTEPSPMDMFYWKLKGDNLYLIDSIQTPKKGVDILIITAEEIGIGMDILKIIQGLNNIIKGEMKAVMYVRDIMYRKAIMYQLEDNVITPI